jgi:hypothetical protein
MGVKKRMRRSIMAVAEEVWRRQPRVFVASNNPKGRDKREIADLEDFMARVNSHTDTREQWFYEKLYANYKGDPSDLPWNRGQA